MDLPARSFDLARPGVAPPLQSSNAEDLAVYAKNLLLLLLLPSNSFNNCFALRPLLSPLVEIHDLRFLFVSGSDNSASVVDENDRPATGHGVSNKTGSDVIEDGVTSQYDGQSSFWSACSSTQSSWHNDFRYVTT